jgi:hypothetical protein
MAVCKKAGCTQGQNRAVAVRAKQGLPSRFDLLTLDPLFRDTPSANGGRQTHRGWPPPRKQIDLCQFESA